MANRKMRVLPNQKQIVHRCMQLTGSSNFNQLEEKLETGGTCVWYVYHEKIGLSFSFFLRMLIYLDMKPSELFKELGIPEDHFSELR